MFNRSAKSLEELSHIENIKKIIESLKSKSRDLKNKHAKAEKSISKYAKKNPWKFIGLSVLAGLIISKLFSK